MTRLPLTPADLLADVLASLGVALDAAADVRFGLAETPGLTGRRALVRRAEGVARELARLRVEIEKAEANTKE